MNYILVTPSPRWQITLPKRIRDNVNGVELGKPLKMFVEGGRIVAEPVGDPLVTKPKYSAEEYKKRLMKYESSGKVYWTAADDKSLAKLKKKDDKYLDW